MLPAVLNPVYSKKWEIPRNPIPVGTRVRIANPHGRYFEILERYIGKMGVIVSSDGTGLSRGRKLTYNVRMDGPNRLVVTFFHEELVPLNVKYQNNPVYPKRWNRGSSGWFSIGDKVKVIKDSGPEGDSVVIENIGSIGEIVSIDEHGMADVLYEVRIITPGPGARRRPSLWVWPKDIERTTYTQNPVFPKQWETFGEDSYPAGIRVKIVNPYHHQVLTAYTGKTGVIVHVSDPIPHQTYNVRMDGTPRMVVTFFHKELIPLPGPYHQNPRHIDAVRKPRFSVGDKVVVSWYHPDKRYRYKSGTVVKREFAPEGWYGQHHRHLTERMWFYAVMFNDLPEKVFHDLDIESPGSRMMISNPVYQKTWESFDGPLQAGMRVKVVNFKSRRFNGKTGTVVKVFDHSKDYEMRGNYFTYRVEMDDNFEQYTFWRRELVVIPNRHLENPVYPKEWGSRLNVGDRVVVINSDLADYHHTGTVIQVSPIIGMMKMDGWVTVKIDNGPSGYFSVKSLAKVVDFRNNPIFPKNWQWRDYRGPLRERLLSRDVILSYMPRTGQIKMWERIDKGDFPSLQLKMIHCFDEPSPEFGEWTSYFMKAFGRDQRERYVDKLLQILMRELGPEHEIFSE